MTAVTVCWLTGLFSEHEKTETEPAQLKSKAFDQRRFRWYSLICTPFRSLPNRSESTETLENNQTRISDLTIRGSEKNRISHPGQEDSGVSKRIDSSSADSFGWWKDLIDQVMRWPFCAYPISLFWWRNGWDGSGSVGSERDMGCHIKGSLGATTEIYHVSAHFQRRAVQQFSIASTQLSLMQFLIEHQWVRQPPERVSVILDQTH